MNQPELGKLAVYIGIVFFLAILGVWGWLHGIILRRTAQRREENLRNRGNAQENERVEQGEGLDLAELARRLDIAPEYLEAYQPSYRAITLKKRSGGTRRLLAPDDETKQLQRKILRRLLARLRTHPAATGFEPGVSIVDNARPHAGQAVVLSFDIVDFFPSTFAPRVELYFRWVGWGAQAAEILTRLTTAEGGLPQGAPTSPRLANLVNFYLDVQLSGFARKRKGQYTRYADDITLSFPKDYPRRVRGVIQRVRRTLKAHGYQMHGRGKLHVQRRHQQQRVTGLVVNEKPQLPRATRRWLRAVRHRRARGGRPTLSDQQLAGWTALEAMIARQSADE